MWGRVCETLGRRTASQNVVQFLLTVMNHTGLKWLPKCGTITTAGRELHRTQMASQNAAQLLLTVTNHTRLKWLLKMWHNYY